MSIGSSPSRPQARLDPPGPAEAPESEQVGGNSACQDGMFRLMSERPRGRSDQRVGDGRAGRVGDEGRDE